MSWHACITPVGPRAYGRTVPIQNRHIAFTSAPSHLCLAAHILQAGIPQQAEPSTVIPETVNNEHACTLTDQRHRAGTRMYRAGWDHCFKPQSKTKAHVQNLGATVKHQDTFSDWQHTQCYDLAPECHDLAPDKEQDCQNCKQSLRTCKNACAPAAECVGRAHRVRHCPTQSPGGHSLRGAHAPAGHLGPAAA